MEITEVRVKLAASRSEKLKAFATVTLDNCFVVRDIKVISGTRGLFVAMPSRRLTGRCPHCRSKNHLRAQHCNDCGLKLPHRADQLDDRGRAKLHADIAHPINQQCRRLLQESILEAYNREIDRSKQAGYKPPAYENEFAEDAGPEGDDEGPSTEAEDTGAAGGPPGGKETGSTPRGPSPDRREDAGEGPDSDGLGIFT